MAAATTEKPKVEHPPVVPAPPPVVEEPEPPRFVMPPVQIGDHVMWYEDADFNRDGYPGVVTRLGLCAIQINCMSATTAINARVGVRHVSDPAIRENPNLRRSGGWDYSPLMKRLIEVESKLKDLGS